MMGEGVEALAWDSRWLGFPVARYVAGPGSPGPELLAAVEQCRARGVQLLYLVLDPANASAATAANQAGARLVDEKLTYQLMLSDWERLPELPPDLQLSIATDLTPQLQELAWLSGEYSRFRVDARIGQVAFEELYDQWLRQALARGIVWTLAAGPETLGLLAFDVRDGQASIELLAVAPAARRRRIGQQLVNAAGQEARRRGHATLQVVTQGENQPARHFYEGCGFRRLRTEHVYHLWL